MVKRIAYNVGFAIDVADDGTYVPITQIKTVVDAPKENAEVDMTCMTDVIDQLYPAPITTVGEMAMDLYWDQADTTAQGVLNTLLDSKAVVPMRIIFNFETIIWRDFTAWVKNLGEVSYDVKNEVMRNVTVQPMTLPTDGPVV